MRADGSGSSFGSPEGWRWESYGGVEVRVPAAWAYGISGWPPCLQKAGDPPYVGRPGGTPLVYCGIPVPRIAKRTSYLWFDEMGAKAGGRAFDGGWVKESRVLGGVTVTVFTDNPGLRHKILDSARVVRDVDVYGCPLDHRVRAGPDVRPARGGGGLETIGTVESVTVCQYMLEQPGRSRMPAKPLLSGSRLTGSAAQDLIRAILVAPAGEGPNSPEDCAEGWEYGDAVIVLIVRGDAGEQAVFVRYSGCNGNATDDGTTRRQLTADVLQPLLASGPHPVLALHATVAELVWPNRARQRSDG